VLDQLHADRVCLDVLLSSYHPWFPFFHSACNDSESTLPSGGRRYVKVLPVKHPIPWSVERMLEYYIFIVQSSFPFVTVLFTTVTDFPIFGIWTQLHSLRFALMS
jgi:hypothetical protein